MPLPPTDLQNIWLSLRPLTERELYLLTEGIFGHSEALVILSAAFLLLVLTGIIGNSGFTFTEVVILVVASLIGGILPPIWQELVLIEVDGVTFTANVLGIGIPLLISAKVALSNRLRPMEALAGLLVIAFVAFEISAYDPSHGIVVDHFTIVPLVGALLAIIIKGPIHCGSPPLAYFYGSMGILIGADLFRLPQIIQDGSGTIISIGGAGISDAIFLAGIVAVAMDAAIDYYTGGKAPGRENPESETCDLPPGHGEETG